MVDRLPKLKCIAIVCLSKYELPTLPYPTIGKLFTLLKCRNKLNDNASTCFIATIFKSFIIR